MESKIKDFIEKYYWAFFAIFLAFLGFLCFFKLGIYNIGDWDEARHGVNAYEMIRNNNYIANYYGGKLDYYNLKPPLSYYIIMLGYVIFGYNPFGLRFFSALSYIILAACVALFVKKKANKIASLISILVFCGSYIFFINHFVKTGDADAVFILFVGLSIISLGLSSDNANWLHLSCFMFALAFLCKSWHAFLLLPIIFFYWLFTKAYKKIKWWQYITCFLCAVGPILIWALARYSFDGLDFFNEMLFYDLLKRSANAIESHVGYPLYYTVQLFLNATQIICLILFAAGLIKKLVKKEKLTDLDKLCLISFLSVLLIFAIAKTKLSWYIFPACIPLTISGSIYAVEIFKWLSNKKNAQQIFKYSSLIFIVGCMTTSTVLVCRQTPNELQTFINTLDISNQSTVYYEVSNTTTPAQGALLAAEFHLDIIINKGGGYSAFEQDFGSYIIMTKNEYLSKNSPQTIEVVKGAGRYVLLYNAGANT